MKQAPAVIIHGLEMARAALAPGLPVCLLSAPGAAGFAGVGWWRAVIEAARASHPATCCTDLLDCGHAPGRVLEALRAGQTGLILHPSPAIAPALWEDLAQRARACGGVLLRDAPPALDLRQAGAGLLAWLEANPGR